MAFSPNAVSGKRDHPDRRQPMRVVMLANDSQMIDRRILQEAATLVRGGHQVDVLCGFEVAQPTHYVTPDGVRVHRYSYDWDDERLKKLRRYLPNHDLLRRVVN